MSQEQKSTYTFFIKGWVIGDRGVGKTSLIQRDVRDEFSYYVSTVQGTTFDIRTYEGTEPGEKMKAQWWDYNGKQLFGLSQKSEAYTPQVIFLVYDVTDEQSFQNIKVWKSKVERLEAQMVLIGNKCDLRDEKVVETARGQALADELGIPFFETSAKTNVNVSSAFQEGINVSVKKIRPPQPAVQPKLAVAKPQSSAPPKEKPWYERLGDFLAGNKAISPDKNSSSSSSSSQQAGKGAYSSPSLRPPEKKSQENAAGDVKKESDEMVQLRAQLAAEKAKSERLEAEARQKAKPVGFQAEAKKARENKLQYEEPLTQEERIIQIRSVIGLFEDSQVEGGLNIGEIEVPSGVKCSVSGKIMTDPVVVEKTGQVCERTEIEKHYKTHPKEAQKLIPADNLKKVIDEWKEWAGLSPDQQPGLDL